MKVQVLRNFPYAGDKNGITTKEAVAGTEIEMWDDLVEGLIKEGYVRAVEATRAPATSAGAGQAATDPAPAAETPAEDAPRKGKGSKK